jgi:hypothetical protein
MVQATGLESEMFSIHTKSRLPLRREPHVLDLSKSDTSENIFAQGFGKHNTGEEGSERLECFGDDGI